MLKNGIALFAIMSNTEKYLCIFQKPCIKFLVDYYKNNNSQIYI